MKKNKIYFLTSNVTFSVSVEGVSTIYILESQCSVDDSRKIGAKHPCRIKILKYACKGIVVDHQMREILSNDHGANHQMPNISICRSEAMLAFIL